MSQFDSSEGDARASSPVSSGEVETPRGGFMARPGLKAPPRHAVVVRVGDAPTSEEIPVARSSFPPPPPSFPPPESLSEKITLRAIPTPRAAQAFAPAAAPPAATAVAATMAAEPAPLPAVLESVPPPSDAPVVASVEEPSSAVPHSRRAARSRLTILAAAMAGLVLGVVSVVTTVHVRDASSSFPAAAAHIEGGQLAAVPQAASAAPTEASRQMPASSVTGERRAAERESAAPTPSQAPARGAAAKRSIF